MTPAITDAGLDLGIVVADGEAALAFYRDALGLELLGSNPLPGGGATMHRLRCGASTVKLVAPDTVPADRAVGGGLLAATGLRYLTISVTNIDEAVAGLAAAGHRVLREPVDIVPGARIAIVADPDGNPVEFLQMQG